MDCRDLLRYCSYCGPQLSSGQVLGVETVYVYLASGVYRLCTDSNMDAEPITVNIQLSCELIFLFMLSLLAILPGGDVCFLS